jgi:hypothetical protein
LGTIKHPLPPSSLGAKDSEQFYSSPPHPGVKISEKSYKRVSLPIFTPIRKKIGILINFALIFGKIFIEGGEKISFKFSYITFLIISGRVFVRQYCNL